MPTTLAPWAAATMLLIPTAFVLVLAVRRRRRAFAPMATASPPMTVAALTRHRWLALRHKCMSHGINPGKLEAKFDAIRKAFSPQQVDYSNTAYGKNHWKLSCFMEYTNGVAAGSVDLTAGQQMLEVCQPILKDCDGLFLEWYETLHPTPRGGSRELVRMQSFVTRYRPSPDETHLPRHIDGANVSGSLVLGLPTYDGFGDSGGLTVWDGENEAEEFVYPVAAGDVCLLDSRVWHQSNPIARGERWVIVIFYEVKTRKPARKPTDGATTGADADAETGAANRSSTVRALLATRIKEAAKRREASEAGVLQPTKAEAVWSS